MLFYFSAFFPLYKLLFISPLFYNKTPLNRGTDSIPFCVSLIERYSHLATFNWCFYANDPFFKGIVGVSKVFVLTGHSVGAGGVARHSAVCSADALHAWQ